MNRIEGLTLWEILVESVDFQGSSLDNLSQNRLIRSLVNMEVTDLVTSTNQRLLDSNVKSVEELQELPYDIVGFSEDMYRRNRQLKDFLHSNLYRHYRVIRIANIAERIITALFNAFLNEPAMIPHNVQEMITENGSERTICDYIAGLTDRGALEEYRRLFDPSLIV